MLSVFNTNLFLCSNMLTMEIACIIGLKIIDIEIYTFMSEVQVAHDTNPLVIILIFSQLKPGGSSYTNLDLVKLNHVYSAPITQRTA